MNKITKIILAVVGICIVVAVVVFIMKRSKNQTYSQVGTVTPSSSVQSSSSPAVSEAVDLGKRLSHGVCQGTGSKKLGSAPMNLSQVSVIEPYGLMAGGHVTPVDHQYYWGTEPQTSHRDAYDVLAPADGTIVEITHRGDKFDTTFGAPDVPSSDEYRVVISYSCDFFSYADLITTLDPQIKSAVNGTWTAQSSPTVNIPVKQGQRIGYVGGQSLDFAVWDLTKTLPGLLVPDAYNNAEPWKVHTVQPLDYFTPEVAAQVKTKYVRTAAPLDGTVGYDQDGKLIGTWFKEGTNGYAGGTTPGQPKYWTGHLSFVPDFLDPSASAVSIGNYQPEATQFYAKGSPDFASVDTKSGMVKYELVKQNGYTTSSGNPWDYKTVTPLKAQIQTNVSATIVVQLLETRKLKVEVFPGKTASQVTGFDSNALIYTRGDGATTPTSHTAS